MIFQITTYGRALFQASSSPPVLTSYKVGSDFNYLPAVSDIDIHGTTLFTSAPGLPVVMSANMVKYSMLMDTSIGTFQFGEIGIFHDNNLVALGTSSTLIDKIKAGTTQGNIQRIDAYLSEVGMNYDMVSDSAESNNGLQLPRLISVDVLPPSGQSIPNVYVVQGATSAQTASLAYTDRHSLWNFDNYAFGTSVKGTVVGASASSITVSTLDFPAAMAPQFLGDVILQFASGPLYSICRNIESALPQGANTVLGLQTVLAKLPNVGDTVWFMVRNKESSREITLPIASTVQLGIVQVGSGLAITPAGILSVDLGTSVVTQVNGQSGIVTINASNLPGLAAVGKTNNYNDLDNKPTPYTLPIANVATLGGVKKGNGILIAGDGTISVDTSAVVGIATTSALGVVKIGSGIAVTADGTISMSMPIATAGVLGAVKIGSGITVAADGTISAATAYTLPIASAAALGGIRVGSGLAIDGSGILSSTAQTYTLPVATASVLGGVKQGTGVTIGADGTLNVSPPAIPIASVNTLGGIKVGSGLSIDGAGVLNVTSAYTLPVASGTILGGVKIGSGINQSGDGTIFVTTYTLPTATTATIGGIRVGEGLSIDVSGVLSANAAAYVLPVATASVLGGVKQGSGVTIAGDGTISASPVSDSTKLDRVAGIATSLRYAHGAIGNSTGTFNLSFDSFNSQYVQFLAGAMAWSLTGFPAAGVYAEVQLMLRNGGLATNTFPSSVFWIKPDGTFTQDFAAYIGAQRVGATTLQTAGLDFIIFFTVDGGTTVYAKVL